MARTILVTGASKGIGRAVALRLARDGFDVTVHFATDRAGAEETAEGIREAGRNARVVGFDIAERTLCREALEVEVREHGAYWGIVLCAGITRDAAFPAMAGSDWDDVLRTNLDGFYNVLQPLVMPMVQARKGGRIVALSSVSGIAGNRGQTNYAASKAGLIGAVKSLALELAKRHITVNCVAPGVIETQMTKALDESVVLPLIPMRRYGHVDDIAGTVSFLLSGDAAYITRQVISVNGGMI
ncbi:MAG: 3-oxoacyl-ACP reductase FabG [Rhodospirillales bacterium]